jgi:hypothetical protein
MRMFRTFGGTRDQKARAHRLLRVAAVHPLGGSRRKRQASEDENCGGGEPYHVMPRLKQPASWQSCPAHARVRPA